MPIDEFDREEQLKALGVLQARDMINLDETTAAPSKPRKGDIRLADGSGWNPGSGAGFYGYYGGAWTKLG